MNSHIGYVDGFVILIPKKNLVDYKKAALMGKKLWMKYGALDYKECFGDDINTTFGMSFSKLTKAKPSEMVIFSYIGYKSKAHRDQVNKKVMSDLSMKDHDPMQDMPWMDMKKFSYGGFKVIVSS